tara:strand:+ start:19 stop:741 length:723 start_codon:yes stop_codon:yes gene_type:complete
VIDEHKRILLVIPHEDDGEGGCGGSVAGWAQKGADITFLLCTNGDKGTSELDMTSQRLANIRQKEQLAAAEVLGVKQVSFMGYPDGELEDDIWAREYIVKEIRKQRPSLVMCIDPFRSKRHAHRDHRISGLLALDAVFTYSWSPTYFPEHIQRDGLKPHRVSEVYLWSSENPDTYVDISDTMELKAKALAEHASQMKEPDKILQRTIDRARIVGKQFGVPYAESFRKVIVHKTLFHWAEY